MVFDKQAYMKQYNKQNRYKYREKVAEYKKKYYQEHKKEISEYKKEWAESYVKRAIKNGSLSKKPCEICGAEPTDAHHNDYNKPLEVRWLCRKCHNEWHKNNKPIYKGE